MNPNSIIAVTGDNESLYNLYMPSKAGEPHIDPPAPKITVNTNGASTIVSILRQVIQNQRSKRKPFSIKAIGVADPNNSAVAAIWTPSPIGPSSNDPDAKVWRRSHSLKLGNPKGIPFLQNTAKSESFASPKKSSDYNSDILVIEDTGASFRYNPPSPLISILKGAPSKLPDLILLNTRASFCSNKLWWALEQSQQVLDRLVVTLPIGDLRQSDIRVSKGISWERTLQDLSIELQKSPALAELRKARHVIVTLNTEGAIWMERNESNTFKLKALFDPSNMEGEWSDSVSPDRDSNAIDSILAAVIPARCLFAKNSLSGIREGIERGIFAMRCAKTLGHGFIDHDQPEMPFRSLTELISTRNLESLLAHSSEVGIAWNRMGKLTWIDVPDSIGEGKTWRILEKSEPGSQCDPLYVKARRVTLYGSKEMDDVPYAQFGACLTADRDEIESLRNLNTLIKAYRANRKENKPLSLAVFGPPGAGKSFAIKQIAKTVVSKPEQAFLEFNLSQFSDPDDLIGAFHQVRDKVLEGKLPVVFWDEFDSQKYKWLQFLLAPMQDGRFQEGQITHPIGRCIFVFAGATSYTFENFGPPKEDDSTADDNDDDQIEQTKELCEARAEFRLKKGPDFISRIHGYLNVLGPNPRQIILKGKWQDDPQDVCFPVRRALLLRALLGFMDEKTRRQRLDIDGGLLIALLETGHYRYGARSMEKILLSLAESREKIFRRSFLPTDEVLDMNIEDLENFKSLMNEPNPLEPHIHQLAPAIHAHWISSADRENSYRTEYNRLDLEAKGDNIEAAKRIPSILGLVGLRLEKINANEDVSKTDRSNEDRKAKKILHEHLETLAEEEHHLWMEEKLANGWRLVKRETDSTKRKQQRDKRLHDCLVPYQELPEKEKTKDRSSIRWYPEMAKLAGFKIVSRF